MRGFTWLAGLTLGLAWAGAAHAQSPAGSSIFNIFKIPKNLNINVTPNIAPNYPMDYRNVNAPIGTTIFRPNNWKLSQLFYSPSRTNTISNTVVGGRSIFPTPAQMQAAAPGYFRAFQMYRAPLIQP